MLQLENFRSGGKSRKLLPIIPAAAEEVISAHVNVARHLLSHFYVDAGPPKAEVVSRFPELIFLVRFFYTHVFGTTDKAGTRIGQPDCGWPSVMSVDKKKDNALER